MDGKQLGLSFLIENYDDCVGDGDRREAGISEKVNFEKFNCFFFLYRLTLKVYTHVS